jgi:molecular chaperone DnaJ
VKIPAGIATGQRLRLTGEGEAGSGAGPAGDLYVVVHVQDHPFFHRDGNDLFCEIPLNYPTLALGGEIKIPTLEGEGTFKVPEGTTSGATFRLRGKGMPDVVSGRSRGDLLVTVKLVTPKKVTREQRKLLEQLAASLPQEKFEPTSRDDHEDRGLFDRVKDIFG